jgi:hypothetical protein
MVCLQSYPPFRPTHPARPHGIQGTDSYSSHDPGLAPQPSHGTTSAVQPDRPRPTALLPPSSNGKPEAATAAVKLLMMGMRMPETC